MNNSMANDHPFQHLFETLGRTPIAHAESVNRQAYEILSDILTVPVEKTGRCILLRAPRAGHGKTHLLSRIQHQLGASYEFIPLLSAFGCRIDASTVLDDTLRRLVRQLPASGGLCMLDLVTRRLFASALQPLVSSGEVPCQDREGALTALRTRPIETFDFHHPNAITAHWARENFEVLGQRLGLELAQRCGLPVREVSFWVDVLFRFSSTPLENNSRVRLLAESVHGSTGMEMERLEALLGLTTLLMRVVLVADDLEGFSTDETSALRLAAFLGSLRQSVERLDVILSLNQDIWQSAFLPRLSGGLADRLSEVVVELEPLKEAEMAALLESRVPGLGSRVLERIDMGAAGTHARGLIRAAGLAWLKATAMDTAPAPVVAPVPATFIVPPPETPPPQVTPPPVPEPQPEIATEPVAVNEPVTPEPEPPAPVLEVAPVIDLPPNLPPVIQPQPFAPVPEVDEPVAEVIPPAVVHPAAWPAPEFSPAPLVGILQEPEVFYEPVASLIPPAPPVAAPEPLMASYAPSDWQESPPAAPQWNPPPPIVETRPAPLHVDSPFHAAAKLADANPPAPAFTPSGWQQPQPFIPPAVPPAVPPPPTPADTDRVDDLLRQFRDRYGRGSL